MTTRSLVHSSFGLRAAYAALLGVGLLVAAVQPTPAAATPVAISYDELEPADRSGANDLQPRAEPLLGVGSGSDRSPRVQIHGHLVDGLSAPADPDAPPAPAPEEDNGSILSAASSGLTGIGTTTFSGTIGDGPHGLDGDKTGDFDFFSVRLLAGQELVASQRVVASTAYGPVLALYAADGTRLQAVTDQYGGGSTLRYTATRSITVYVMLAESWVTYPRAVFPADPFDSASGPGQRRSLTYTLSLAVSQPDTDFYRVDLAAGDVLAASVTGGADELTVFRPNRTQMVTSRATSYPSSRYPASSPLPRGGNADIAYVAEKAGSYALRVRGPAGAYDVDLAVLRPGPETDRGRPQTVFLDFDGAAVDTQIFASTVEPGTRYLSPLAAYLPRWGLTAAQKDELIARVTAVVKENVRRDLIRRSTNPNVSVRILTSSDSPDLFGRRGVSRVIVGGDESESDIYGTGIAQDVDPGNFDQEDQALVPLGFLSAPGQRPSGQPSGTKVPDGIPWSINSYLEPSSDRLAAVANALGNVISQQIGSLVGVFPTDGTDEVVSLSDSQSGNYRYDTLFGLGPDATGGTADDVDVDFVADDYASDYGLSGLQDTRDVAAWGLARHQTS